MCIEKKKKIKIIANTSIIFETSQNNTFYKVRFKNNVYRDHHFIISNLTVYDKLILDGNVFYLYNKKNSSCFYIDQDGNINKH